MTDQILEALGYDPELCSPDPVAWARGFRERFDIVTRQRDAAERECEALRKELQRVSEISERDTANFIALHRDLRAANDLLKRIARAVAKSRTPVPNGPLDVQVAHLAGRAA